MRTFLLLAFLLGLFMVSLSHEYWLEPETFFLAPNQTTSIHLYVGDGLVKDREERPYQASKTTRFQLFSQQGATDLRNPANDGRLPFHTFSAERPGNYLFSVERNWSYLTLDPEKFEAYLREDGLEYIIAERKRRGETNKQGRERYSRCIKSLLQVGDKRDEVFSKDTKLRLEIIPLENPYDKKQGDSLSFQVLFDGKPLANKTVFAENRNCETQRMVTDQSGVFTMNIAGKGLWLARLVYMQRCETDDQADWESFWGAFSFGAR